MDSGVGTNGDLFVMVANKGTETDSDYHQLIATLRETISSLKDELRNKQVTKQVQLIHILVLLMLTSSINVNKNRIEQNRDGLD